MKFEKSPTEKGGHKQKRPNLRLIVCSLQAEVKENSWGKTANRYRFHIAAVSSCEEFPLIFNRKDQTTDEPAHSNYQVL